MDRRTAVAPGRPAIPGVTAPLPRRWQSHGARNPDPYLVLGVSRTATQAEITHAYRTAYAPIIPTHAEHRPRKPLMNTYGMSWPPTPCCATPPAAPNTTAVPLLALSRHHISAWYRKMRSGPTMDRPGSRSAIAALTATRSISHRRLCVLARPAATTSSCENTT